MRKKGLIFVGALGLIAMAGVIIPNFISPLSTNANYEANDNITLSAYLEKQENSYTNKVSRELEEYLNEKGVFDSEISNMSKTELEQLNEVEDVEDLKIEVNYYRYDEETGETSIATVQDVSSFIMARDDAPSKNDIIHKLGEKVGVIPTEAYASYSSFTDSYTVSTSNNLFKATLIIRPSSSVVVAGQVVNPNPTVFTVQSIQTWVKAPKQRELDIYGVKITGADFTHNQIDPSMPRMFYNAYAVYDYNVYSSKEAYDGLDCDGLLPGYVEYNLKYTTGNLQTYDENGSIVARINLPNDGKHKKLQPKGYKYCRFNSIELHMVATVTPKTADTRKITASSSYLHAEKKLNVDFDGIQISGSWSSSDPKAPEMNVSASGRINLKTYYNPVPRKYQAIAEIDLLED